MSGSVLGHVGRVELEVGTRLLALLKTLLHFTEAGLERGKLHCIAVHFGSSGDRLARRLAGDGSSGGRVGARAWVIEGDSHTWCRPAGQGRQLSCQCGRCSSAHRKMSGRRFYRRS